MYHLSVLLRGDFNGEDDDTPVWGITRDVGEDCLSIDKNEKKDDLELF